MNESVSSGGCLCGAVRFEITGAPRWVAHCHCQSCRRHSGSPMTTFAGYRQNRLRFTGQEPRVIESSPGVWRGFCSQCGSPLTYRSNRWPDEVHVYLGALNDPDGFPATFHVYCAEQVAWLEIHDDLPRFSGTAVDAKPVTIGPAAARTSGQ